MVSGSNLKGLVIKTIDNPGWVVRADGENDKIIMDKVTERNDGGWLTVNATATEFIAYCGADHLNEVWIEILHWLDAKDNR